MGLHLTGKGSILDTIGHVISTGVRDVGDVGSLAAGWLTGNQTAQQHALSALRNNNANLGGGGGGGYGAPAQQQPAPPTINSIIASNSMATGRLPWDTTTQNNPFDFQQKKKDKNSPIVYHPPTVNIKNIKDHNLPGSFNATPQQAPDSSTDPVAQLVAPAAHAATDLAHSVGTLATTPYNAAKLIADSLVDPNSQATRNARTQMQHDSDTAIQFAQFLPRALAQGAESLNPFNHPSQHVYTPPADDPVAQALFGKQPIPSLENVYKTTQQQAGTPSAVGTTGVNVIADLLAAKGGKDIAKGSVRVAKKVADNAAPLDQSGKIQIPGPSSEDNIHKNNPLNPEPPTPTPGPEPTPADLKQSARAAAEIDHTSQPIDFAQVEGAGQRAKEAVTNRATTLRQLDASARGGQLTVTEDGGKVRTSDHTPFYRQFYADNGKKPTVAAYQAEADRQLRTGQDQEALNYQNLQRHADAEQELKQYTQADKQSGYNKVRVRNAPAGTPKQVPEVVRNKINSPEYTAKRASGEFLQRVRDELPSAKAEVVAIDKQVKKLSKSGDISGIRDLNTQSTAARLKLRYLQGQERAQSGEYGRLARALDEAHPEAVLKQKGTRPNATVSGVPVKGGTLRVASKEAVVDNTPLTPEEYRGFTPRDSEEYSGPNLNEGAFSAKDREAFERQSGIYTDKEAKAYSPDQNRTLNTPPGSGPRNLAGDTAAFEKIKEGGTIDDAVKAYQEATGASEEEATAAVNRVTETGADMGTNEEVLKRNPVYGKLSDFETKDMRDVADKADSYRNISNLQLGQLNKVAEDLSESDIALLDQLRGHSIEEVAKKAENPEQFTEVAQVAKQIADYNHEVRRLNGDATIYRQNYGAGMHYAVDTPKDIAAVSGYRDTLASTPGFSEARLIGDYEKADSQFDLRRKNANFLEDVANDSRQTINYVRERAIHRSLQDVHGNESVHYGNPTHEQPAQLNGTKDVFATKEVAKEWNKLNPQRRPLADRNIPTKVYDAVNSGVVQGIVVNPAFHGSNQVWQALEASGQIPGVGRGATEFMKNTASMTKEDMYQSALGIYEHGGHIPDYGKNQNGLIARATHGLSNVNREAMAGIEFRFRTSLYKAMTDGGVDPRLAVKTMEKFMGDKTSFDIVNRRLTLFLHYFKTLGDVQVTQVLHPLEYKGSIATKVAMLGVLYGLNKALQAVTGNDKAYIRAPGGAGLIKEEVGAAKSVVKGHYRQALGIVTNRINPILKEAAQQGLHTDLFTGQDITGNRAGHAVNSLVSPAQIAGRAVQGKKSWAEIAANEAQINVPHTKDQQATSNSKLGFLNTPGAKAGNGIAKQEAYFDSLEGAKKTLPAARQKVYDDVTAAETDKNGNKVGMNDSQAQAHYAKLSAKGNEDILRAVTKQKQDYAKKTGTEIDPLYSSKITDAQRQRYIHIQSLPYKGDDYIQQTDDPDGKQKGWIRQLTQDRIDYFKKQDFSTAPPSERVLPPKFDDQTEADLTTADGLSGKEKAQFILDHPNLQNAYDAIAKYTNDKRVAQNNAPFKLFPKADPETQAIINEYMGLPEHDGSKGGNKSRSLWIKANPDRYAKLQNYFASVAEFDLANSAGQDKYQGATPSQKMLKAAYSLGKYDIYKAPDGTYSINPSSASQSGGGFGGSGGGHGRSRGFSMYVAKVKQGAQVRAAGRELSRIRRMHPIRLRTISQNRRAATRGNRIRTKGVKVASRPKTGKLRIKAATVA